MGLPLETQSFYTNGGGLNLKASPTKVAEDEASLTLNIDYTIDGAFTTRYGSTVLNVAAGIPAPIAGNPKTLGLFPFRKSDGTAVNLIAAGTAIYAGFVTLTPVVTGLSATLPYPDFEPFVTRDDEWVLYGNGVDANRKFNGTTWTNLSITTPGNPTVALNGAGALTGTFDYYVAYVREVLGVIVQISDLNPVAQTIVGAASTIRITRAGSPDAQATGWVIYRRSPTSVGVFYQIPGVIPIATTIYDDNVAADGTIEAEFDNQPAPISKVIESNDFGEVDYVDAARPTDVYTSKPYLPWNVPEENLTIFDGPVRCIKRIFGVTIYGTDRSIWVRNGSYQTADVRRVSSAVGILNNRCAVGKDQGFLYILGTNKKVYSMTATDFSQNEIRFSDPLSLKIDPLFSQISSANSEIPCMEYYDAPAVAKVVLAAPVGNLTNNRLIIYNEIQSLSVDKPCWQVYDNINASALKMMNMLGELHLNSGDYNGLLWHLDDSSVYGDGSEINGTVTSATGTTLTDSTQTWTVNEHVGKNVRLIAGFGVDQVRTVISNTATQVTVAAWTTVPNITTEFTIGGYDVYHYSNWKFVLGSYDILKQLWFIWYNANASGDYEIDLILQFDFNQTVSGQSVIPISLRAGNAIWGSFIWGAAIWGAQEVFEDRQRYFWRFRSMRVGFRNRKAGQPFQINGFGISSQNKELFFRST